MNMDVKTAVDIAMDYVKTFDMVLPTKGMRLEETEIADNGNWLVTLSFLDPDNFSIRVYKRFEIDTDRKEVRAMRIRNPLAA